MPTHLLQPFRPQPLPIPMPRSKSVQILLEKAYKTLDKFETILSTTELESEIFGMLAIQESLESLHSQHISSSIEEILKAEEKKRQDSHLKPILNYLKGIQWSQAHLKRNHLKHADLFKLQQILQGLPRLQSHYRKKQNWIGPKGEPKDEAYFFPPSPDTVHPLMTNLIAYWNQEEKEPLLQLAIFFAQLLIIHPFMDGNGRIARILIPTFLYQKGITSYPYFFLSRYFRRHRLLYFQNLYNITSDRSWKNWIEFFLKGICEQGNYQCKQIKKNPRKH